MIVSKLGFGRLICAMGLLGALACGGKPEVSSGGHEYGGAAGSYGGGSGGSAGKLTGIDVGGTGGSAG
jgi:hypothetical protein